MGAAAHASRAARSGARRCLRRAGGQHRARVHVPRRIAAADAFAAYRGAEFSPGESAKTDEDLDALGTKLDEQLQTKGGELSKQLTDTVVAAISQVAKDKSYTAIVDKKAVLFGGADVTDDVLKQLNKK